MGQSNHWGFCLVFCFFHAVILSKRMSSPIFCPYGFIALQKKSLVSLQRCWILWQREQQACCSAIQHTSGVLKTLFVVEGHGTPKTSPTVVYSSGAEEPSLLWGPRQTLCLHCPLSSISRPQPQHLPQFRCRSLLPLFAREKAQQDHLLLPETQR